MTKFIIDNIDFITLDSDRRFILALTEKLTVWFGLVRLTLYILNLVDLVNIQYRKIIMKKVVTKYLNEDG